MNGSTVSQTSSYKVQHTHTGTHGTVQWSGLFSAVASLWKPPPLPLPNTHRRHHHSRSRPLLSAPLGCEETIPERGRKERNCRGGCRGKKGKKKKYPFTDLSKCVIPPVIPRSGVLATLSSRVGAGGRSRAAPLRKLQP